MKTYEKKAYEDGARDALQKYAVKSAAAKTTGTAAFFDHLLGRNVRRAVTEQQARVLNTPHAKLQTELHPDSMGTFNDFVASALRGKKKNLPVLGDLPSAEQRLKGPQKLMDTLGEGHEAVQHAKRLRNSARLNAGGAIAAPTLGTALGIHLTKSSADTSENVVPLSAGGVAAGAPIAQGVSSGALSVRRRERMPASSLEALRKNMRKGDVLMVSTPETFYRNKALISTLGADPYGGFHVANVTNAPKNIKRPLTFVESTSGTGAAWRGTEHLDPKTDYVVKRYKDPEHAKKLVSNLNRSARNEEMLQYLLGERSSNSMYDKKTSYKGALGSFLPKPLHRLLLGRGKPDCGRAVCSSLTAMNSPVPLRDGIPQQHVMPHHVQSSNALETVGRYQAPRTRAQAAGEYLHRASPWALRGMLGAGLGYGAYRGAKALMGNSDD